MQEIEHGELEGEVISFATEFATDDWKDDKLRAGSQGLKPRSLLGSIWPD
jgi:hypothetical protein